MKITNFTKMSSMFFLGILCFLGTIKAQETFYKTFSGNADDFGNFVSTTNDGGYIIVGKTSSFGAGNYDVWLIKTNSDGDTVWTKTYGGVNGDEGRCVRQTSDGGYLIAANTSSYGAGYQDGWIFKTDASGNMEWDFTFGGSLAGDGSSFILPVADNYFIICGVLESKSYTFKIDEEGNKLWEKTYFTNNSSGATSMCAASNGNYAVIGDFQMFAAGPWYPNLFLIDGEGNLIWQITYTSKDGSPRSVLVSSDNGFLITGAWNGTQAVMKTDNNGVQLWEYLFPFGGYYTYVNSAVETDDNNFVVTGTLGNYGNIAKLSSQGDTLWTHAVPSHDNCPLFSSMQKTSDEGFVMTGWSGGSGEHYACLAKTDNQGNLLGINEQAVLQSQLVLLQNSPNPFINNTSIQFSLPEKEVIELAIYDTRGNKIRSLMNGEYAKNTYKISWNGLDESGSQCSSGIYYYILKNQIGLRACRKMLKIK